MEKAIEFTNAEDMVRLVETAVEFGNEGQTEIGVRLEVGSNEDDLHSFTFTLEELETFVNELEAFRKELVAKQLEED